MLSASLKQEAPGLDPGWVHAFEHLLLVVDVDRVTPADTAELVAAAARDTKTIYRAMDASIQIAGNGYQVQMPPARDAGFAEGDRAQCDTASGVLIISNDDATAAGADAARCARDLVTLRSEQIT